MAPPPKNFSRHDWPWLIATLVVSVIMLVSLATWLILACRGPVAGSGGCLTSHFGVLLWMVLSLVATVVSSVQLARLRPHVRGKH